jgi:RNA polymerase sigma-70 factor (ECF subfamily)
LEQLLMERVVNIEPTEVTDRELVARCQAGDEAAFDGLVQRHQQRALNVAYQLLHNREDATEVAQDAFVRIYGSLNEFRGDCEFTTWLHQIVVNLARNKHRWWKRRARSETVPLDDPSSGPLAGTADPPDVEAVKAEFVRTIGDKMAGLPAHSREVLVLRNVEELSYEQIALVLDCSVGTVKSRIARAREQLRKAVREAGL